MEKNDIFIVIYKNTKKINKMNFQNNNMIQEQMEQKKNLIERSMS